MSVLVFLALAAPALAQDADGDGYAADDCDDADPTIHPGASEGTVADGIDQDCTGVADDVGVCPTGAITTVQEGVDLAGNGFVVRLCPARYTENVRVVGKRLTLQGDGGARVTGLDGQEQGAALAALSGAELTVRGVTLFNGASAGDGGGLRCVDSAIDVADTRVMRNRAGNGGGIGATGCQVTIDRVQISDNVASGDGGNLWLSDTEGTVADATIVGGEAQQGGGLLVDGGDVVIERNTIADNTALSTDSDYVGGGGVHVDGTALIRDNVVQGNHAEMCGGGLYLDGGSSEVVGNVVSDNTADEDGAGVYFDWTYGRFAGNSVLGNAAVDDAGGLRVYRGSMVVEDNTFQWNTANDDGGGVKMSHAEHTYRRNIHRSNHTGDAGGGLEMDNDTSHIEDCTFEGNSAGRGGGLHSWRNEGELDIRSSVFVNNEASDCGGGLAFDNDPYEITLYDLTLEGNHSDNDGGALCLEFKTWDDGTESESLVTLLNSVVTDSSADDEGGLAFVEFGRLAVVNSVVIDATAPTGSQGRAEDDGVLSVRNSVLVGGTGGSILDASGNGVVNVSYTDLWDNVGGYGSVGSPVGVNGVFEADPLFVSDTDLHPDVGSPLVDAGDPALLDPDGSVSDLGVHGGPHALP